MLDYLFPAMAYTDINSEDRFVQKTVAEYLRDAVQPIPASGENAA